VASTSSSLLAGRTAVVTGASRGIGAAVAEALAAEGVRVALVARTRSQLDEVASRIGGAIVVEADLSTTDGANAAADEAAQAFNGVPDIFVSNAGVFRIAPVHEMDVPDFDTMVATNLTAPFALLSRLVRGMRERGSGHVVTIGSVADRSIFAGNAAYSATKFASRAVHEVLREETRGSGVRVTLVSPAAVDTDIWDPIQFADGSKPDRRGMLDPAAVAEAVVFAVTRPASVNIDELRLSRS
jgi:NADP-dependent 3-hydroxy acid dehydrogenase YdfG